LICFQVFRWFYGAFIGLIGFHGNNPSSFNETRFFLEKFNRVFIATVSRQKNKQQLLFLSEKKKVIFQVIRILSLKTSAFGSALVEPALESFSKPIWWRNRDFFFHLKMG